MLILRYVIVRIKSRTRTQVHTLSVFSLMKCFTLFWIICSLQSSNTIQNIPILRHPLVLNNAGLVINVLFLYIRIVQVCSQF